MIAMRLFMIAVLAAVQSVDDSVTRVLE